MSVNTWHVWTAGVLDMSGSVQITDRGKHSADLGRLDVSVGCTDREVCDQLKTMFGGCVIVAKKLDRAPQWQLLYIWTVTARQALACLRSARPFMARPTRIAIVDLAIEFQEQKRRGSHAIEGYRDRQFAYIARSVELHARTAKPKNRRAARAERKVDASAQVETE